MVEELAKAQLHQLSLLHSALDVLYDSLQEVKSGKLREGVPDISWTTKYAILAAPYKNIYTGIGTTWASSVITFPTVAVHILGELMKFIGPDSVRLGLGLVRSGMVLRNG